MLEGSADRRRGLFVGWFGTFSPLGALLGALVGLLLSFVLSPSALDAYGWRIAFMVGALALPLGVWLRRSLPETFAATPETPRHGVLSIFRDHKRVLIINFISVAVGNIGFYVLQYATTYAQTVLYMSARVGFAATVTLNLVGFAATVFGGWLSDLLGRRPVLVATRWAMALAAVPAFVLISVERTPLALLTGLAILAFFQQAGAGAFWVWFAELLPVEIRGRAFGTVYGLGVALFGGTAQMVVAWLTHVTGSDLAPAWYLAAAYAVCAVAVMLLPETAPARMAQANKARIMA